VQKGQERSPAESTRVHRGVDPSDADSIRVLSPESTNPPTLSPRKNLLIPPSDAGGAKSRSWVESARLRGRTPIMGNGLDFSAANTRATRGPLPIMGLARERLSTGFQAAEVPRKWRM
jgi:hypothetical protein